VPEDRPATPSPRLGYLLKLAHLGFGGQVNAALASLGIDTRQWGTLVSLDDERPLSQAEIALLVGIDRTTMVAVVDDLESKGLVVRRSHREDRRKNVVEITDAGRDLRERAAARVDECEREFLSVLSETEARQLKAALVKVIPSGP
jgi:DNA-binding MarR family transcriptional regulator